jgi:hypothetical protein
MVTSLDYSAAMMHIPLLQEVQEEAVPSVSLGEVVLSTLALWS